jgi:hypothetical protein
MQPSPHPPTPAPPLPHGTVTGIFLRPPAVSGCTLFERQPQADAVPAALGHLGLEGSQEWHRLEKNAGKLSAADAADRALLMQVTDAASMPRADAIALTCALLSV